MDSLTEKLLEYSEKFNRNFPIFIERNLEEEEIIKIIDNCIKNNKPHEVKIEKGICY